MTVTVTWEAVLGVLGVIGALAAWVRAGYTDAIRLAVEQMKNESLRAINELRADADERYASKAEWLVTTNLLNHLQTIIERRHENR